MEDTIKVTVTVGNIEKLKDTIDKAEKSIRELKGYFWELSNLKTSIDYEKENSR